MYYIGWSSKYDKWIPVTSPRLLQFERMSFKFFAVLSSKDDIVVNDSTDLIHEEDLSFPNECAIISDFRCTSSVMVKLLNRFHTQDDGFNRILKKIRVKDPAQEVWCPFSLLTKYVKILGQLHGVFYITFAR